MSHLCLTVRTNAQNHKLLGFIGTRGPGLLQLSSEGSKLQGSLVSREVGGENTCGAAESRRRGGTCFFQSSPGPLYRLCLGLGVLVSGLSGPEQTCEVYYAPHAKYLRHA